jgi:hypothetical protein
MGYSRPALSCFTYVGCGGKGLRPKCPPRYREHHRSYKDMATSQGRTSPEDRGITSKVGQVEIDWPRSLGFFGAIGAATALELIPIPIAFFVASVPFLKLLNRPNAPKASRIFSQVVDGASKPVGGDSEGTVHWSQTESSSKKSRANSRSPRRGRSPRGGHR